MKKIIFYLGSLIFTTPCISLIACSNRTEEALLFKINKGGSISSSNDTNFKSFERTMEIEVDSSRLTFISRIIFDIYNIKGDKKTFVFKYIEVAPNDGKFRSAREKYGINKDEILKMYNWLINKN